MSPASLFHLAVSQVWSTLEHFSEEERSMFLRFVRGISCLPSEELLRRTPFGLISVSGGAQWLGNWLLPMW